MTYTRIVAFLVMFTLLISCLCACGETVPQDGVATTTTGETQISQSDVQTTTQADAITTSVKESTTEKQETTTVKDKTTTAKKTTTSTTKAETTVVTTTTTAQTTVATTTTKAEPITALTPLSPEEYYGYTLLKKEADGAMLTQLYKHFVESVERMDATIDVTVVSDTLSMELVKKVWNYYQLDYPQHFWTESGFNFSTSNDYVKQVSPFYSMTMAEREEAQVKFDAVVTGILSKISGSWGDYRRELAVHDALCNLVTYRDEGDLSHCAYGALVNKAAVCEGYSEAFQYLMYQVGTQCLGVFGTANKVPHKWNIVYIDGVYYDVDVTWDDPVMGNDNKEVVAHAYFNLSDAMLFRDHDENDDRNYPLPPCESMDENYYTMQGVWLHDFSEDAIVKAIQSHGETIEVFLDEHTTNEFSDWLKEHWKSIRQLSQTEYRGYRLLPVGSTVTITLTK